MTTKLTLGDLLATDPLDQGCDAGFDIIDQYIELELAGRDAAARFPGLAVHLRTCPGCRADHDGILDAARAEP
jgi:hypothetical protein